MKGHEGVNVAPTNNQDMLEIQKMKKEQSRQDVSIGPNDGKDMLKT